MISLIGGELYQWDTGRIVRIDPDENVTVHEVHFTTKRMDYAYVLKTYIEDGVTYCAIPNIILQQTSRLLCYEVCENSDGEETIAEAIFNITKRNRPEDYIYTEQEYFTVVALENRLAKVEKSIPTKISQLNNDSGYLTEHQSLVGYAKKTEIPTTDTELSATSANPVQNKIIKTELDKKLESIPVDGTTIKFNDQGQLTLALSNANGVNF